MGTFVNIGYRLRVGRIAGDGGSNRTEAGAPIGVHRSGGLSASEERVRKDARER
jgi:hypothetical protein